jgi:hypothetical protein
MTPIEFEKPENWSFGKRTGFLSIILLIIGPLILFFLGSIIRSYSVFVAFITIILMVSLLYTNTNIFLERGGLQRKINHFILIVWGGWQSFSYLELVAYYMSYEYNHFPYTLITGLLLTVMGFLLCMVAGFIEWIYPDALGPQVLFRKKAGGSADKVHGPEVRTKPAQSPNPNVNAAGNPGTRPAPAVRGNPHPEEPPRNTPEPRLSGEEEKTLQRWARHIGSDGRAYEQCIRCGQYGFITTREGAGVMTFSCPSCNSTFTLKK